MLLEELKLPNQDYPKANYKWQIYDIMQLHHK